MSAPTYENEIGGRVGATGVFPVGPNGLIDSGAPAAGLRDVNPADADLPGGPCRSLLVTVDGDLVIETSDGSEPTAFPVKAGQTIVVGIRRVKAATTATVKAYYGYAPAPSA